MWGTNNSSLWEAGQYVLFDLLVYVHDMILYVGQGRIQGGGGLRTRRAPPLKLEKIWFFGVKSWFFIRNTPKMFTPPSAIGKNMIFWRKIVIFHTKYPNIFRASLRSAQFFKCDPPNLKSWIRPCRRNINIFFWPLYCRGPSWPWSYGSWIYNYLCNQCLSPLMSQVRISIRARCITLCDKVCQWLATGRLVSSVPPVSSTNKTDQQTNKQTNVVLSILLLFTTSDDHFGIFKLFFTIFSVMWNVINHRGNVMVMIVCNHCLSPL